MLAAFVCCRASRFFGGKRKDFGWGLSWNSILCYLHNVTCDSCLFICSPKRGIGANRKTRLVVIFSAYVGTIDFFPHQIRNITLLLLLYTQNNSSRRSAFRAGCKSNQPVWRSGCKCGFREATNCVWCNIILIHLVLSDDEQLQRLKNY